MSKAYSMDLRARLVRAVETEGMSRRAAAERFGVAASTAVKWLKRLARTGSVAPGRVGGRRPRTFAGAHRDWLVERCRNADFTLRGLVRELAERGLKVDYHSVWDFVHAEGLTHKKRRWSRPNRIPSAVHPTKLRLAWPLASFAPTSLAADRNGLPAKG